jgi:hypothetical protein
MTNRTLLAAALAVALGASAPAVSQSSLQRFPLHKAIPEPALTVCRHAEVPIQLNKLMAEGREVEATKTFEHALIDGECINARGVVVYTRQVHRVDADDGSIWTVYEANAGREKFYVPMMGYLHEDMSV